MSKYNEKSRAGKRYDRNRNFTSRNPILGYYLIITDTEETERNYFEGLRDSIPENIRSRIVIRVEKAKTTYDLIERTRELLGNQAQQRIPWIVIDRDEVKEFDRMTVMAEQENIHVGWSNPCFEIWMHAYLGEMPISADSVTCCRRFEDKFEKVTGQKYQKNDTNIYEKLNKYGDYQVAIKIARQRMEQSERDKRKPSEAYSVSTVYLLVSEIMEKIDLEQTR